MALTRPENEVFHDVDAELMESSFAFEDLLYNNGGKKGRGEDVKMQLLPSNGGHPGATALSSFPESSRPGKKSRVDVEEDYVPAANGGGPQVNTSITGEAIAAVIVPAGMSFVGEMVEGEGRKCSTCKNQKLLSCYKENQKSCISCLAKKKDYRDKKRKQVTLDKDNIAKRKDLGLKTSTFGFSVYIPEPDTASSLGDSTSGSGSGSSSALAHVDLGSSKLISSNLIYSSLTRLHVFYIVIVAFCLVSIYNVCQYTSGYLIMYDHYDWRRNHTILLGILSFAALMLLVGSIQLPAATRTEDLDPERQQELFDTPCLFVDEADAEWELFYFEQTRWLRIGAFALGTVFWGSVILFDVGTNTECSLAYQPELDWPFLLAHTCLLVLNLCYVTAVCQPTVRMVERMRSATVYVLTGAIIAALFLRAYKGSLTDDADRNCQGYLTHVCNEILLTLLVNMKVFERRGRPLFNGIVAIAHAQIIYTRNLSAPTLVLEISFLFQGHSCILGLVSVHLSLHTQL